MSGKSGLKQVSRRLKAAFLLNTKYPSTGTMPHAWPMMVAKALPSMPHPNTMTKRKLNTMHMTVPNTMVYRASCGLPAVRRKLLRPMPTDWNTKPKQMICTNALVGA